MTDSEQPINLIKRRDFLKRGTLGIGSLALSHLLNQDLSASSIQDPVIHHPPRAKNVIFLHMVGGPSQMDTFDPNPLWINGMEARFPWS